MARPTTFDPDQALWAALLTFWERGYARTSIADLVDATGLSRSSLYGRWGDKDGLFLAALDWYAEYVVAGVLGPLEADGANLDTIVELYRLLIEQSRSGPGAFGCLLAHTASERSRADADADARVEANRARMESAFAHALRGAAERGQLRAHVDPDATAASLTVFTRGLTTQIRAGVKPDRLHASVQSLLALFRHPDAEDPSP